jgi:hypothetical protein
MRIKDIKLSPPPGQRITTADELEKFFNKEKIYVVEEDKGKFQNYFLNLGDLYCHVKRSFVEDFFLRHIESKKFNYTFTQTELPEVFVVTAEYKT